MNSASATIMNRRIFLCALGVGALGVAGGCGLSLEDGIFNPCLSGPLPERLRNHDVVRAAWTELIRRSRGIATPILSVWVMETRVFGLHRR